MKGTGSNMSGEFDFIMGVRQDACTSQPDCLNLGKKKAERESGIQTMDTILRGSIFSTRKGN